MKRASGIILPIASLPSPYGIGTLGKAARDFIDFLEAAHQSWWQVLPVGPTSFGDSPYQSPSAFAGNPYFIDLDVLIKDGLLTRKEVLDTSWGKDASQVDYALLYEKRLPLLRKAYERGAKRDADALSAFQRDNAEWLSDYALFMAVKRHFGMVSWIEWGEEDIRLHLPEACEKYRLELADEIRFESYLQFLFFSQWEALRSYAHAHGVQIIGDLPIYVALDSADVWANPQLFQLDEKNIPVEVAGVPPDSFTADGQLWGNPLYDYEAHERDGFGWWIRRVGGAAKLYDMIRIDHFRGFESYWAVPYGEKTAKNGRWVKGPGMKLVGTLTSWFSGLSFIAEDLGYHTPEVEQLLHDSGLPGMKVLEFAFDSRDGSASSFQPHCYNAHCVCYVGTHDNTPIVAWKNEAEAKDVALAREYIGLNDAEGFAWGFIRAGMGCVAELFFAQMQDYLELGADSRTNVPGTLGNNWKWRLTHKQLNTALAKKIARITDTYGRGA